MVYRCAVHHLQDIFIVQVFVQLLGNSTKLLEVDNSVLVLVEQREDLPETGLCLGFTHLAADDVQELRELNWFILVSQAVDK